MNFNFVEKFKISSMVYTLLHFNEQHAIDCHETMKKLEKKGVTTLVRLHQ
jgi:predicted GIY-YIG superfamily endonuclease